jgi:hypothetical protein
MNWLVSFVLAVLRPALGLIILAGLFLYWVLKHKLPKEKSLKIVFFSFAGIIIFQSILSTSLNYWLWSQELISQQLLPPHSPISYVLKYSWQHYWFEPIITILFSFVVFLGIYLFNKKFEENLFYDEEKYLAAIGILATGWPNCLIFLCLVLFSGIIFHLINIFFNYLCLIKTRGDILRNAQTDERAGFPPKAEERGGLASSKILAGDFRTFSKSISSRLSLLYFWLPCALLVLLLGDIISKYIGVIQFSI